MKLKAFFSVIALASAGTGFGQYATDPVGVVSVSVPAVSDVAIGAPLHRSSEFQGRIKGISGSTLTLVGNPGWTTDIFKFVTNTQTKTYFVRIDSGTKEGMWSTILNNGSNTLTVNLNGENYSGVNSDDVNGVDAGDYVSIIPYWTPSTLIGAAPVGAQLFLYRPTSGGINVAPTRTFSFNATSGNWILGFSTIANHEVLFPGEGVVLRNPTNTAFNVNFVGSVPMAKHRLLITTLSNSVDRDQRVVYQGAVPEKIGDLVVGFANGDQLFFYNNSATGINKSPSTTLTWRASDSKWIQGFSTIVSSTFEVSPGASFTYRKKATVTPQSFVWQDLPSYLQP